MNTPTLDEIRNEVDIAHTSAEDHVTQFYKTQESVKPPEFIFHYTNDTALRLILLNGNMWLSDVFSTNDPSEIYYGLSHAISKLESLSIASNDANFKFFYDRFHAIYTDNLHNVFKMFAASFSDSGDKLDQWRAYGDDGRGYALVFEGSSFEKEFIQSMPTNNSTISIDYNPVNLANIHDPIINLYTPIIGKLKALNLTDIQTNQILKYISIRLSYSLLRSGLVFKHPAYSNESEFRVSQLFAYNKKPTNLQIRHKPHKIIQYVDFPWRKSVALKKIIIGPAADKDKAYDFVYSCLDLFGYSNVVVESSRIPYRSFK